MEENSNKRAYKSFGSVKFMKMYFFFSFVIFTAVLPIQSLYIPVKDSEVVSSKKDSAPVRINLSENDITSNGNEVLFLDEDGDEDDIDLEDALNDYYDSLLDELELELKSFLESEAKIRAEKERGKKKNEEKFFPDYDYMSDMPAPEPETPDKKTKGKGESQLSIDDGNYTWGFDNGTNSTLEDLHMLQKLSRESQLDEGSVLRMRELRLNAIKNQILSLRGGKGDSNGTVPDSKQYGTLRELYEKNLQRLREWTSSNKYPEKVRSFYPSCDVPKNTDEDLWTNPNSMNILFDLEFPKPAENATINIVAAKLRLYKMSQVNLSMPLPVEPSPTNSKSKQDKGLFGVQNFGLLPIEDDRQIRISVYWYTRSLRRNKVKRKLLDSQMFSVNGDEWTEFNIRTAVRSWRETRKNFGLFITVEDEDGSLLPADQYLHAMNCSKWTATVRPIPSIIMDAAQHYMMEHPEQLRNNSRNETDENGTISSSSYNFQNLPYPILDLCTVEVPESEGKDAFEFNAAKLALETQMLNLSRRRSNFDTQISNFTIVMKNDNYEPRNFSRPDKSTRRRMDIERNADSPATRSNYFQTVGLGSPSAGQNRNVLVPIITKSELEMTDPSDLKIMRMQNDSPSAATTTEKEVPRFRHNQKQWEAFQKKVINHARLKNDSFIISTD